MNTPNAKNFLNVELQDDSTPFGGKSHRDEILQEFLDECGMSYDTPMDEVNHALIDCGIKPIKYDGYAPKFYTREEVFAELESRKDLDPTLDWELCYEFVADRGRNKPLADLVDEWENMPNY